MAQRTQLRLGTVTGSYGTTDGAINDQGGAVATGSIVSTGLDQVLSDLASSIKRIHGSNSFSENLLGAFSTDLLPAADDVYDLGSASAAWQDLHLEGDVLMTDAGKIATAAGALTLDSGAAILIDPAAGSNVLIDGAVAIDAGVVTGITSLTATAIDGVIGGDTARAGTFTAVIGTTGVYSGILKTDDATEATSTTDGSLQTDGGLSVAKSAVIGDDLDLLSDGAVMNIGSTSKFTLTAVNSNNAVQATANHRLAFGDPGEYIAGDGTDLKIISSGDVDITATLLDITGAGAFSGNLTVAGNLDVNGTTTTVDSSHMTIEDGIIGLGVSGSTGLSSAVGDRGLVFMKGAPGALQAGFWYDGSKMNLAKSLTSALSHSFVAPAAADYLTLNVGDLDPGASNTYALGSTSLMWSDAFLGAEAVVNFNNGNVTMTHAENLLTIAGGELRMNAAQKVEFGGASDFIQLDTDLKIIAGADIVMDPGGGDVKVDGNVIPNSDSADSLGVDGTAWLKLYVDDIDLNGAGRIDLDADADTSIRSPSDDVITFEAGGVDAISINASGMKIADTKSLVFGDGNDITLTHDGGTGLDIVSAGNLDLSSTAGSATLTVVDGQSLLLGKGGGAELFLEPHVTAGNELATLMNTAGTTDGADAVGAILLSAVAGGIGLAWADDKDLWAEGGQFVVTANHDTADAIKLHADAGSSQTILVQNDAGTSATSILANSTLGGVKLASGKDDAASIHLVGYGMTFDGGDQNDSFLFNNSPISMEAISAPSSAANKLYNVGGALYWGGSAISDTSQKQIFKLGAAVAAGSNISGDANASTFDVSNIVTADHLKKVDIFVNGQLMVSGSEASRAASTADYHMEGTRVGGNDNAIELKFAFGLEAEDIVQVSVK